MSLYPAVKPVLFICVSFLLEIETETPQLPQRGVTACSKAPIPTGRCQGPLSIWDRRGPLAHMDSGVRGGGITP